MLQKHTAQGRLTGFEDQIKDTKKTLKTDQYKDAEKKYTEKMIDLRVGRNTGLVISALQGGRKCYRYSSIR